MNVEHGNKGAKRPSIRGESAKAWMTRYFNLVVDKMPHNKQIHLPSWDTQKDVYQRFREDMELQNVPASSIVALSTFYRIWADDFPNVVIPEVRVIINFSPFHNTPTLLCVWGRVEQPNNKS